MADYTPKVIESTDTTILERGTGRVRHITRTHFMLGDLGPFKVDIDADKFTQYTLKAAMDEKAATFNALG